MAIISRDTYKQLAKITDESLDSLIDLLIPEIEKDYLKQRGAPFEVDIEGTTVYPNGSTITAKLMLDWLLSPESGKALSSGMKSETIGKYSYSLNEIDTESGYPKAIIGRIDSFIRSFRWE